MKATDVPPVNPRLLFELKVEVAVAHDVILFVDDFDFTFLKVSNFFVSHFFLIIQKWNMIRELLK